jgi:hypothetical protein
MTSKLVLKAVQTSSKSGVNYLCADCGTVLYHTGVDGAFEGGEPGFASRQPHEVAENLTTCPECGRRLNPQPDPDTIRVKVVDQDQSGRA